MTQEWDDILSEPMAQLQPDLPAAAGGWRAVRSIEEVSPRPQQPPLTLPEPDGMLSVRLPVQPEEATPASAPPPASLTGQLSLTWASRRRGRRTAEEEPAGDGWPAWEPEPATEPEPVEPTPLRLSLARPLRSLMRLFQRQAAEEPAAAPPVSAVGTPLESLQAPVAKPKIREESPELPLPRPAAGPTPNEEMAAPLVLAHRPGLPLPVEPVSSPAVLQDTDLRAPREVPAEPEPARTAVTRRQDNVLRRWLARKRPVEADPGHLDAPEEGPASLAPFAPVPLVARHEHATSDPAHEAHGESAEAPSDVPPPMHLDEGDPLPPVLRERMEKLLDVPLKDVRVFRNSVAHEATHAHGADALAIGTDVHIAPGLGDPSTPSGQALLAHELSHVAARIAGKREPAHLEEQHAQSIEHAVRTQPDLLAARRPAASAPALEHRAQPRSVPAPVMAPPSAPSYSGGGFVGGDASSATAGSSVAVQRAPVGRIPAVADSLMGAGSGGSVSRSDSGLDEEAGGNEPGKDEPGGVDRIVEAVMRRLRREGSLERERRGSFRSEIGG